MPVTVTFPKPALLKNPKRRAKRPWATTGGLHVVFFFDALVVVVRSVVVVLLLNPPLLRPGPFTGFFTDFFVARVVVVVVARVLFGFGVGFLFEPFIFGGSFGAGLTFGCGF